MAADVDQDAAVGFAFKKPVGTRGRGEAMRAETDNLQDASDGTFIDEVARVDGALGVKTFTVVNGVLLAGLGDLGADGGELVERDERSFVDEVVFAVFQNFDTERSAITGNAGRRDQFDVGVVKDFLFRGGGLRLRERLDEAVDLVGVWVVGPAEIGACFDEAVAHAVDVSVVEADGGNREIAGGDYVRGFAFGGVIHSVGFLHFVEAPLLIFARSRLLVGWAQMRLWSRRSVLAAGVLLPGFAQAVGRGTRVEHGHTEIVDELTERPLSRLTDPKLLFHLPHYHHRFLAKNNRFIILGGEADGTRQIHYYDLRRNRSSQLTQGPEAFSYSATFDEAEDQLYFLQGDALKRVSLKGRGEHAMFRCPSGWRFTGHVSVSSGARTAAVVEMREDDFRDDPEEQFAARPQCRIRMVDLATGKDEVLVTERAWIVHPQFRPGRQELLYAHEGPGPVVEDRLRWIGADGKNGAVVRAATGGRMERGYWSPDGAEVRFVHYVGDTLRGATIRGVAPETGDERQIARCSAFGWMRENVDGSAIAGASRRPSGPNIYVLFPRLDREITLCEHGASGRPYPVAGTEETDYECARPETVFSADSQWVYFMSDRHGKPALYRMDVEDLVGAT